MNRSLRTWPSSGDCPVAAAYLILIFQEETYISTLILREGQPWPEGIFHLCIIFFFSFFSFHRLSLSYFFGRAIRGHSVVEEGRVNLAVIQASWVWGVRRGVYGVYVVNGTFSRGDGVFERVPRHTERYTHVCIAFGLLAFAVSRSWNASRRQEESGRAIYNSRFMVFGNAFQTFEPAHQGLSFSIHIYFWMFLGNHPGGNEWRRNEPDGLGCHGRRSWSRDTLGVPAVSGGDCLQSRGLDRASSRNGCEDVREEGLLLSL